MRLIDADALEREHKDVCSRSMKYNLDLAPTIDAVPVVRCRECKRYKMVTWYDGEPYGTFCDEFKIDGGPDFYCAYGQRREDGDA